LARPCSSICLPLGKEDYADLIAGCCPGAALAPTANADDLADVCGVFQGEAQQVQPGYRPRTVGVDDDSPAPTSETVRRFTCGGPRPPARLSRRCGTARW
jgi:hypothetical protein